MKYHFLPIVLSIALALAGCSAGTAGTEPPADDLASPTTITNADGVPLRIGMSRAECEEVFDRSIENGWRTTNWELGVTILSVDDVIEFITTGEGWGLSNGVKTHMPIDEVRELLGDEDSIWPEDDSIWPYNDPELAASVMRYLVYQYDGGGELRLEFRKADNEFYKADTVSGITIHGPGYDETLEYGVIATDVIGEGNATLKSVFTTPKAVFVITHTGAGAMKVYFIDDDGAEKEIFSGEGDCNDEVESPLDLMHAGMYSLRVEAEGEWRIVVKVPISSDLSAEFPSGD